MQETRLHEGNEAGEDDIDGTGVHALTQLHTLEGYRRVIGV